MRKILTFEDRYGTLVELGDLSLALREPFVWEVRHNGVFLLERGEAIVVTTIASNPYAAVERHWSFLTEGAPIVISRKCGVERHVFWTHSGWIEISMRSRHEHTSYQEAV